MTIEETTEIVPAAQTPAAPNFFARLLRGLLRLLLTALVGAVLGGALYFGARAFYRQAVLVPARESLARMDDLAARQSRQATQSAEEMGDLRKRLALLEKKQDTGAEDISSLQAEVGSLGIQLERSQESLTRLDDLEKDLSAVATQAMGSREKLDSMLSSSSGPVTELRAEIQLLRAMELLNRCRLYLSQNNYGLAAQDAAHVREIFVALEAQASERDRPVLQAWIARLDLAISNLGVAPVLAGEDLEMVWRMVLLGLPGENVPAPAAAVDGSTPTPTPWLTAAPPATPTPLSAALSLTPTTTLIP